MIRKRTILPVLVGLALAAPLSLATHGGAPGNGALDGWVDVHGDTMYGALDVGLFTIQMQGGALSSASPGVLDYAGKTVCYDPSTTCVGAQGIPGPQGVKGPIGDMGPTGPLGLKGPTGNTGAQGPQGIKGLTGDQGPKGLTGDQGATGIQGPTGPTGPTGPQGPQGPQGDAGAQGIQGTTGPTGPDGPQGFLGDAGPQGIQGTAGMTGPTGSTGPKGPVGDMGHGCNTTDATCAGSVAGGVFRMNDGGMQACVTSCVFASPGNGRFAIESEGMWLNIDGPDAAQYLTFYDGGNYNGAYLAWEDSSSRFALSRNTHVYGTLTSNAGKFVQIHPTDPTKAIHYLSIEGPEHGVYWRGSAQLVDGEARIDFPDVFTLVLSKADPVTAKVTLTSDANGLYVAEKAWDHIIVKEKKGGSSDATFDFLVTGVRDGYHGYEVVKPNTFNMVPGLTPLEQQAPPNLMQPIPKLPLDLD